MTATAPQLALRPAATLAELVAAHTDVLAGACREMAALRRAFDAAKFTPGRQLSDIELHLAHCRLADFEQETLKLAGLVGQAARVATWQELFMAEEAAELTAVPEPEPARRSHRKKRTGGRHLRLEHGASGLAPLAWGISKGAAKHTLRVKPLVAAGAAAGLALAAPSMHTLEDRTTYIPPSSVPSASAPAVPVRLPVARLTANTDPLPVLRDAEVDVRHPFADYKPPGQAPVPKPAPAPAADATPAPSPSDEGDGGSYQSSGQSQSYQSSGSYQSRGRHASPDSSEGNSNHRPQHGDNGQVSNYWQDGSQQSGNWQSGSQQSATWPGGGWQGNSGQHGQRGGH